MKTGHDQVSILSSYGVGKGRKCRTNILTSDCIWQKSGKTATPGGRKGLGRVGLWGAQVSFPFQVSLWGWVRFFPVLSFSFFLIEGLNVFAFNSIYRRRNQVTPLCLNYVVGISDIKNIFTLVWHGYWLIRKNPIIHPNDHEPQIEWSHKAQIRTLLRMKSGINYYARMRGINWNHPKQPGVCGHSSHK